jgi:hypothetical protein
MSTSRNGCLSYELFGRKHPYVSSYPNLSSVVPNVVSGMELMKQLNRKKSRPVVPSKDARDAACAGMNEYVRSCETKIRGYRSGKRTIRFISDVFNAYGMYEKNTRLRFVSDFGVINDSVYVEGVTWEMATRASEKLKSCIASCKKVSPLRESWEYVHEGCSEGMPRFFPTCPETFGCREPDFLTRVHFPSSCDRAVVTHTKRVRLWACTFRPEDSPSSSSSSSFSQGLRAERAETDDDGGDSSAAESESEGEEGTSSRMRTVMRGLRKSHELREVDVPLAEDCADMRMSILVEKDYALDDRVVLPKATRIVKRLDFDFEEDAITWRYSLSFTWSGSFDEDAEYAMATDEAGCVVSVQVEPLNLSTYMCTSSGPKSSSVYQTISTVLKSMQLLSMDQRRTQLRCIPTTSACLSDCPSQRFHAAVNDFMVWAFRTRRISGETERRRAADRRRKLRLKSEQRGDDDKIESSSMQKSQIQDWDYNFHFDEMSSGKKIEIAWAWMGQPPLLSSPADNRHKRR